MDQPEKRPKWIGSRGGGERHFASVYGGRDAIKRVRELQKKRKDCESAHGSVSTTRPDSYKIGLQLDRIARDGDAYKSRPRTHFRRIRLEKNNGSSPKNFTETIYFLNFLPLRSF